MGLSHCKWSKSFYCKLTFYCQTNKKVYGRNADVIYPPVDVRRFILNENKEDYYVTASRLVPYKRIDLIVDAFAAMPNKN